ncbi:MAG: cold shock domain-containing protein [Clostridia bacterium]
MNTGVVKFFVPNKGYGFIIDDLSNDEYFFHVTKTLDKVNAADKVYFDFEETKRGVVAINVKLIKD